LLANLFRNLSLSARPKLHFPIDTFSNQAQAMQLTTFVLAALTAAIPALAFTNGTLVPAYMCNPHPDGLPKNYGQLLSFTREMTGTIAFNANGLFPVQPTF